MSDLHIPTPCHENWDAMTPTGNGRHCASCNHQVIDIADMPVAEGRRALRDVAATMKNGGGRTCVRAHSTPTGRLVAGRRKLLTTALAGILACSMAGCVGDGPDLAKPQPPVSKPTPTHDMPMGVVVPRPVDVPVVKGEICEVPIKGKIIAPAPLDPPKPEPRPEDGIKVGTVHVDDGDRASPVAPVERPRTP